MSVSSATSASAPTDAAPVQRKPESAEAKTGGADHDGDRDDRATVRPAVNASGQQLGQLLNVKA